MKTIAKRLFAVAVSLVCFFIIYLYDRPPLSEKDTNQAYVWKWKSPDDDCPPKMRYFNKSEQKIYPKTALISYPSSGNGLTRVLLQAATGIYTGDVYHANDSWLGLHGWRKTDTSVIAIKTHHYSTESMRPYEKAILLTRNPYESILSCWTRFLNKQKRHQRESAEMFMKRLMNSDDWKFKRKHLADQWCTLHKNWLNSFNGSLLVIHYEDLVENKVKEFEKILKFLEFEVNYTKLKCLNFVPMKEEEIRKKLPATKELLKLNPYSGFNDKSLEKCKNLVDLWPKNNSVEWDFFKNYNYHW